MEKEKKGFFKKIYDGLSKTRQNIASSVENVFKSFTKLDEEVFEELEEALILADCGPAAAVEIVEKLRIRTKKDKLTTGEEAKAALVEIIAETLAQEPAADMPNPSVILIIGVNGVGKTTTIGKLANNYTSSGKKVILAAADTFRAAAIDQLEIWAKRAGATLIRSQENSDPGAVVFDAAQAAKARGADLLIVDTAGRLHNKTNLMNELAKLDRIITKELPNAHRETYLVLDATTGQNALSQAKTFNEIAKISGIVLTKLDGTAKGGIVISIASELSVPIRYIGLGEQIDDLLPFDGIEFAKAMLNLEN